MGSKIGSRWLKRYPGGVAQRFLEKVDKKDCWLWNGTTTGGDRPYGTFWDGDKTILAHRYSLQQFLGRKLKRGMNALHKCDVTMCVRPEHLYEGTQSDNNRDAYKRKRRDGKTQSKMLLIARFKKLGY